MCIFISTELLDFPFEYFLILQKYRVDSLMKLKHRKKEGIQQSLRGKSVVPINIEQASAALNQGDFKCIIFRLGDTRSEATGAKP